MKTLLSLFAALSALPLMAATAVIDFTTQPSGAEVIIDGERRGTTPLQLTDLRAGEAHHLRYELKDYETKDLFFTFKEGESIVKYEQLAPLKGLLLVTSEPSGAEVLKDGYTLGQTPRLVTSLPTGNEHTLMLRKQGYQDRLLSVRFDGRSPLVHHVKLTLDSGTLQIRTEPDGAEVSVNGVVQGSSPLTVSGVAKGRATVEVKKAGFRPITREIAVSAGETLDLPLTLEPIPATLRLTSVPVGARFYVNGEPVGGNVKTGLAPGSYTVRAELKGYGSVERTVELGHGANVIEEFRMSSVMGMIEFKTAPVGATVYVDGRRRGATVSADSAAETSDVLTVRDVMAGDHDVKVECRGYATWNGHVTVEPSKSTQRLIRLKKVFVPDLRVTLRSGEVVEGVRLSEDGSTLMLQVSLSGNRLIPQDQILRREAIFQP